jgi:hypothetical protein
MNPEDANHVDPDGLIATVRRALRGLRFGSVEIVVHDGRVVQVERRERVRLDVERPPGHRGPQRHSDRADRTSGGAALETDK